MAGGQQIKKSSAIIEDVKGERRTFAVDWKNKLGDLAVLTENFAQVIHAHVAGQFRHMDPRLGRRGTAAAAAAAATAAEAAAVAPPAAAAARPAAARRRAVSSPPAATAAAPTETAAAATAAAQAPPAAAKTAAATAPAAAAAAAPASSDLAVHGAVTAQRTRVSGRHPRACSRTSRDPFPSS